MLVWSTQSDDWLEVTEVGKEAIVLRNEKSGLKYQVKASGEFTEIAEKGKKQ